VRRNVVQFSEGEIFVNKENRRFSTSVMVWVVFAPANSGMSATASADISFYMARDIASSAGPSPDRLSMKSRPHHRELYAGEVCSALAAGPRWQ